MYLNRYFTHAVCAIGGGIAMLLFLAPTIYDAFIIGVLGTALAVVATYFVANEDVTSSLVALLAGMFLSLGFISYYEHTQGLTIPLFAIGLVIIYFVVRHLNRKETV